MMVNERILSLLLANDVRAICTPFFNKMGVNAFSYSKVFVDGSRAELWSDDKALTHTFLEKKYISNFYTPDYYSADERYVFLPSKIEDLPREIKEKYCQQLVDQKELFDHDNCFLVIDKTHEICEYFIFYTPKTFKAGNNLYVNNLEAFEVFIKEFKQKAYDLIFQVDRNKIVKAWRNENEIIKTKCYYNQIVSKRKKEDGNNIKLSPREELVGRLIIECKTAEESAVELGITKRTVESYIDNIKNKLNCDKKNEILKKLLQNKYLLESNYRQ